MAKSRCTCCNIVIENYNYIENSDLCALCFSEVCKSLDDKNPLIEPKYPDVLVFPEKREGLEE